MRKAELQDELSKRQSDTTGVRATLIKRLLELEPQEDGKDTSKTAKSPAEASYILQVCGYTDPDRPGTGVGLALLQHHDQSHSSKKELWSGQVYFETDRTFLAAEYTAMLLGLEYLRAESSLRLLLDDQDTTTPENNKTSSSTSIPVSYTHLTLPTKA